MRSALVRCALLSTAFLASCFDGHVSIGDLPQCGPVTCDVGEDCCDPTCGLCSVRGACPAIGCGEPCGDDFCSEGLVCCLDCFGTPRCLPSCPPPCACPDVPCPTGELCCLNDCDGSAFCTPERECPFIDCTPCDPLPCGLGAMCCYDCSGAGSCQPAGVECSELMCDPCMPMDVMPVEACMEMPLWFWNGRGCDPFPGCGCTGVDCGFLFGSFEECAAAFAGCPMECGGFTGRGCAPSQYCVFPPMPACGDDGTPGQCVERPIDCSGLTCSAVCGCDNVTYCNRCTAARAGTDVRVEAACPGMP